MTFAAQIWSLSRTAEYRGKTEFEQVEAASIAFKLICKDNKKLLTPCNRDLLEKLNPHVRQVLCLVRNALPCPSRIPHTHISRRNIDFVACSSTSFWVCQVASFLHDYPSKYCMRAKGTAYWAWEWLSRLRGQSTKGRKMGLT